MIAQTLIFDWVIILTLIFDWVTSTALTIVMMVVVMVCGVFEWDRVRRCVCCW